MTSAEEIIRRLKLEPHPEGGHFRETFRDTRKIGGRSVGTAIYYLLSAGETARWHRVDAGEVWHHYAGAPLKLLSCEAGLRVRTQILGDRLDRGQLPQAVIPAGHWQSAKSTGAWTLVGCTVAPGFEFDGFEMAPPDWKP